MKYLFLLSALLVSACASVVEGSTQTLHIKTAPDYASSCSAKGNDFTKSFSAPGTVDVPKSQYPVEITCIPQNGSAAGTGKVLSDVAAWGYGGAVAGNVLSAAIDAGTGAANKYPDSIEIPLGSTTVIGKTSMNSNAEFNK